MSSSSDDDNLNGESSLNDEISSSSEDDFLNKSIFDTDGSGDDNVSHLYLYPTCDAKSI
jgi:hypothetical protein